MTSIPKSLEIGTTRKNGFHVAAIWPALVSLFARYRNRRDIAHLYEFSDDQLADIGLSRLDLNHAMRGGVFDDHSNDLTRAALLRRSQLYLQ
jgi:uncharacterized protein YjiS (DUF1127 family)